MLNEADVMPLVPAVEAFLETLEGLVRADGYLD